MQMGLRVSELRWPFGEKGKEKSQQLWSLGTVEGWMWKWEAAAPVREATCLAELVLWTRGRLSERSPLSSFNFQQRSWWPWAEQTLHRPDWGPSGQAEAGRAPQRHRRRGACSEVRGVLDFQPLCQNMTWQQIWESGFCFSTRVHIW